MHLAIITLHFGSNVGGILQSYALQSALEQMGHRVEVFDRQDMPSLLWSWGRYGKDAIKAALEGRAPHPRHLEHRVKGRFTLSHLHLTGGRDFEALRPGDFDGYVVGSDQVWRPEYMNNRVEDAFLGFAEQWGGVKRVAYAASFGKSEWMLAPRQTEECARLAKLFDGVGVREDTAVELCRKHLGVEAKHVLDPTMLHDADFYEALTHDAKTRQGEGLFCYILDLSRAKRALARDVARRVGVRKSVISDFTHLVGVEDHVRFPTVEQWLRCYADARCVLTDSFHGAAFSIIFGKPFAVIANSHRGSTRMESLLRMFGLSDRLIDEEELAAPARVAELLQTPFDATGRLAALRNEARGFLTASLG